MEHLVVVTRHPAAITFLAEHLALRLCGHVGRGQITATFDEAEGLILLWHKGQVYDTCTVLASARPSDVRGREVWGNVPLHLAAIAACVVSIEFTGEPPRGQEYTVDEMRTAGAHLVRYKVVIGHPVDLRPREEILSDFIAEAMKDKNA